VPTSQRNPVRDSGFFSNSVAAVLDKENRLISLTCLARYGTHPLIPSLKKRGGTKGGEFKESAMFFKKVKQKGSHTAVLMPYINQLFSNAFGE